jgi:purine-nucleoside phosphorylase
MEDVVFPIRVMKLLGIDSLLITNAAGGMNPSHQVGDLMLINDHINLFGTNPLLGKNIDELGPRFPDMHETYTQSYLEVAREIPCEIPVHEGVYVGVSGPTFETPAEYKYKRIIRGDAVGMSTVPEAIVATHMGLKVLGVSVITDLGVEGKIGSVSHEEVQEAAAKSSIHLSKFVQDFIYKHSLTLH